VQKVVHATRPAKSRETPETLYGRWQQEARELGFEPERLVRQVTGRERSREHDPARTTGHDSMAAAAPGGTAGQDSPVAAAVAGTPAGLAERTITTMFDRLASPAGLTEQASTFTRRQVLCAVGHELPTEAAGIIGPAELQALADRFLAERAVSVVGEHAIGERHYATPEILEVERRLIDAAVSRSGEQRGVCSHDTLRATLVAHPTIGADQAAMVQDITQGGQGVSLVVGKAGTGKTYALGSPAMPGSSTATACSAPPRPGSPRSAWTPRGSSGPARWTRCWPSWTPSAPARGDAGHSGDQNN
jgi:hypothetical protein